jgi:hypothetical protein
MFVYWTYWMWATGNATATVTIPLNPSRVYATSGALSAEKDAGYGQVFISMVCTQSGDQILCGLRDSPTDSPDTLLRNRDIVEVLRSATRVTIKLRSAGGAHRAEGIIWDIT